MREFFILMRVQARALVYSLAPASRSRGDAAWRRRRLAGFAAGAVLLVLLGALYAVMFSLGLITAGFPDVVPALAVVIGALTGVVFTFMKARGTLFGFSDYDLVMSLPVSRRVVVASRAAALYGAAVLPAAAFMLPMYLTYFALCGASPASVICALLSCVLAPLAPTAIATAAAFAVTTVSARFRHANLAYVIVGMLLFIALFVGISYFSFSAGADREAVNMAALDLAGQLEDGIAAAYPPAAWAANGIAHGAYLPFALFCVLSIAMPVVCTEIMQHYYLRINAALAGGGRRRRKVNGAVRAGGAARSPFAAIVIKELRTLLGIPSYAFNCLFGYLFMLVIAIALAIMGLQDLLASVAASKDSMLSASDIEQMGSMLGLLIPWIFGFCAITCDSSCISISLEGRSAWITATMPLSTRRILAAKLASNGIPLAASLAISIVVLLVAGELDTLTAIETAVVGFGMFYLWTNAAIALDAAHPNYLWTSAQEVVKRSAPVMLNVIGGMICVFVLGAVTLLLMPDLVGIAGAHIFALACGLASIVGGQAIFERTARTATFYL